MAQTSSGSLPRPGSSNGLLNTSASLPNLPQTKNAVPGDARRRNNIMLNNPFKKQIMGDIFGSTLGPERSMLGLMYRSRIEERKANIQQKLIIDRIEGESSVMGNSYNSIDLVDSASDSDQEQLENLDPRQQLAVTIRNWSLLPENDEHLIREGAVHAIIALAGMDDSLIKKCCASALYQLSSRQENREELLSLGAATGAITLSMQVRNWKIAKLCAMTLCNLSMQPNCEGIMAKDGALLALIILMGMKGQKLLPVCVQALYNLTCVENHFKGMERVVKAVLNVPQSSFDPILYAVKIFVNCSRFSWLRSRIIEDGALAAMASVIPSLPVRENAMQLVQYIMTCIRLLSDSPGCRNDLLGKGIMELLHQLLPFCDKYDVLLLIKSLHNLMVGTSLSITSFETAVLIVTTLCNQSDDIVTLQYTSACLQIFAKENMRNSSKLATKAIECMPKLLETTDSLTQFFAISTSGYLFFSNLCHDRQKIEALVKTFVYSGPSVKDPEAVQALAVSLAKLSQESSYMAVLDRLVLLDPIMELLLHLVRHYQDNVILESCCVALSRIALRIRNVQPDIAREIASVMSSLLSSDDLFVLKNAIGSIYSLGREGLCHAELLSTDDILRRIAQIVVRHRDETALIRTCCASLAVFSEDSVAHAGLADDEVLHVLFHTTRAEDPQTREFVATTLCNMSINEVARQKMIDRGVVEVLDTLSGATSETIQELCAKCICNLTCSEKWHSKIIAQNILQIILMISLVRSVSPTTKLLCARSLLNVVTEENFTALRDAGAIRVFASLSAIDNAPTQNICARGFLLFTTTLARRDELVQHRGVLQSLFGMVKCTSARTRIIVGMAICNLLACPITNRTAILAGALSVLKVIATMSYDDLKEASARVVVNLSQSPSLHNFLLREPIVSMLVMIMQQSEGYIFDCAVSALACMSQAELFRPALIDRGCITGLVGAVVAGRVAETSTSIEVCRALCFLSYSTERAESMVLHGHILLALHALYHCSDSMATPPEIVTMLVYIVRNLSFEENIRSFLVSQDAFVLVARIVKSHPITVRRKVIKAAIVVVHNLSLERSLHEDLVQQGIMQVIATIVDVYEQETSVGLVKAASTNSVGKKTPQMANKPSETDESLRQDVLLISRALHKLSTTAQCREGLVSGGVVGICLALNSSLDEASRFEIASVLSNIASTKNCRDALVAQGAAALLISLSNRSSHLPTQKQCSLALGHLSDITKVNTGVVASMLLLSLKVEEHETKRASSRDDVNGGSSLSGGSNGGANNSSSNMNGGSNDVHESGGPDGSDIVGGPSTSSLSAGGQGGPGGSGSSGSVNGSVGNNGNGNGNGSNGTPAAVTDGSNASSEAGTGNGAANDAKGKKRDANNGNNQQKSLKSMIQEGISSKKGLHGVSLEEHKDARYDEEEMAMNQKLFIHTPQYVEFLRKEAQTLHGNFSNFEFETIAHQSVQEAGGMAKKPQIVLPLPSICSDRATSVPDRHTQLDKVRMDLSPLPKDCTDQSAEILASTNLNNNNSNNNNNSSSNNVATNGSIVSDDSDKPRSRVSSEEGSRSARRNNIRPISRSGEKIAASVIEEVDTSAKKLPGTAWSKSAKSASKKV